MTETYEEVVAVRVNKKCEKCSSGLMRLNGIVYPTAPYRYVHVCSNEECGYKIDYQCQYPYIKYVTREEADKLTPKLSDIVGITENSPSLIFRALEWGKHKYRDVEYDYATVYCDRDRKRDGTESLEGQTVIIDDRVCEVVRMHTHAMATPIRRGEEIGLVVKILGKRYE